MCSISKYITRHCLSILTICALTFIACSAENPATNEPVPFLRIDNGQFDVLVIIVDETDDGLGARGSGTLSFDYSGDLEGSFSATGPLVAGQQDKQGVGTVITKIENTDFQVFEEVISLLAFHPTGAGKADIFILGSTTPVDSLTPGLSYLISPLGPFGVGVFFIGLDIDVFLAGEANLLNAAENAFVLTAGAVSIVTRDGSQIRGLFEGTTDVQSSLDKRALLTKQLSKIITSGRLRAFIIREQARR